MSLNVQQNHGEKNKPGPRASGLHTVASDTHAAVTSVQNTLSDLTTDKEESKYGKNLKFIPEGTVTALTEVNNNPGVITTILTALEPSWWNRLDNPKALEALFNLKLNLNIPPEQQLAIAGILKRSRNSIKFSDRIENVLAAKKTIADLNERLKSDIKRIEEKSPKLNIASPKGFALDTVDLPAPTSLQQVPFPPELNALVQERSAKHSMDIQTYTENRLSKTVLDTVINGNIPVEIYSTNTLEVFGKLKHEGYTQILKYTTKDGDYNKYFCVNPETKKSKLVLMTLPGKSYQTQVAGSALLYKNAEGKSIPPENMRIFESGIDLKNTYRDILEAYNVKPETIIFGSQMFHDAFLKQEFKLEKSQWIQDPYLNAIVYHYKDKEGNKRTIVTLNMSPHMFGDKIKSFTSAAIERGAQRIIFNGTAGGLKSDLKVGDLVVPRQIANVNIGKPGQSANIVNNALNFTSELKGENVKIVEQHGTVHTPVVETMPFVSSLKENKVDTVECELANLVEAIQDSGQADSIYFSAHLQVTDIPGTEHTNADKSMTLDPSYINKDINKQSDMTRLVLQQFLQDIQPIKVEKTVPSSMTIETRYQDHARKLYVAFDTNKQIPLNFEVPQKTFMSIMTNILKDGILTDEKLAKIFDACQNFYKRYGFKVNVNLL